MSMDSFSKLYKDLLALHLDEEELERQNEHDLSAAAYHKGRKEAFKDSAYWLVHSIGTFLVEKD